MKIFQLIDLIIRLFRLNKDKKAKVIIFGLLSYHAQVQSQIASAFWLGTTEEIEIPCDDNYDKVSLLLHMDGSNNSTVILDNSVNDFVVTPSGGARISTAQNVFGGASASFDGTGDFLTIPSNTAFNYGTGDFTIEGWFRNPGLTTTKRTIFSQSTGTSISGLVIETYYTGVEANRVYFGGYSSGTNVFNLQSVPISTTQWYHFAAVKSGTTYSFYINGVLQSSTTTATAIPYDNKAVVIGALTDNTGRDYFGFIDEVRITKGVARYTSNFTVPTVAFENVDCAEAAGITVDFLVVAGGGGSSQAVSGSLTYSSGGGGAGGYRSSVVGENSGGGASAESPLILLLNTDYQVSVGAGGSIGLNGSNSFFNTITSVGGGGSVNNGVGLDGGSGGGGTLYNNTGGSGTLNQGFSGGSAGNLTASPNYGTGGGGGGAGSIGLNGVNGSGIGGQGGSGITSSITGSPVIRAVGGSGGTTSGDVNGVAGLPNTGNGASGAAVLLGGTTQGALGGSGVVIIRFDDAYDIITTSGNLVLEKSIVAGDRVVKFTSGSGTIEFIEMWDGTQTSLLDNYPTAAAAYSVRALNSAYTGPLMTIRRASNNVETDVYALASGDLDVAWINSFCSGTSCTVRTWYDQSGNGRDAVQTTGANQPLIYASGSVVLENTKPAMDFDGSNDFFTNSAPQFTTHTIISVSLTDTETLSVIAGTNSNVPFGSTFGYIASTDFRIQNETPTVVIANNVDFEGVFYAYNNGSSSLIYANQILKTSASQTGTFDYNIIGGRQSQNPLYFNGTQQELILYPSAKSLPAEITNIHSNINSYYSIY